MEDSHVLILHHVMKRNEENDISAETGILLSPSFAPVSKTIKVQEFKILEDFVRIWGDPAL